MLATANVDPRGRARASRSWRKLRLLVARAIASARRRSLIGDILLAHLTVAALAGAFALAGLWWASGWVIRDNMRAWGEQWLDNLDEVAIPLYLPDDGRRYARTDAYVSEFAEILFVRYYSAKGEVAFTESADGAGLPIAPIERARLEEIATPRTGDRRYVLDAVFPEMPFVRVAKPVWTRSVRAD